MTKSPKKDIIWDNVWLLGRKHILAIRRKEINPQKHVVPFWDFWGLYVCVCTVETSCFPHSCFKVIQGSQSLLMNWDSLPAFLLRYPFKRWVAHVGTGDLQIHLTSVLIKLAFTSNLCQDTLSLVAVCHNNYWSLCLTEWWQNGSLSSSFGFVTEDLGLHLWYNLQQKMAFHSFTPRRLKQFTGFMHLIRSKGWRMKEAVQTY